MKTDRITGTRSRATALALCALLPALLAGNCTAPAIRIKLPLANEVLTLKPVTVEIDFSSQAAPDTLVIALNGIEVTDHFSVEQLANGRMLAYADFLWDSSFVLEGLNQLDAWVLVDGVLRGKDRQFSMEGDPYADAVTSLTVGPQGGLNAGTPEVVLGPPQGFGLFGGGADALSLGFEGEIVVAFTDNVIVDGPGVDFTVFENPFFTEGLFGLIEALFSEPGEVSVSQDGTDFVPFPCEKTEGDHPYYPGCAGVYPVFVRGDTTGPHPSIPTFAPPIQSFIGQFKSQLAPVEGSGGDSFDLADVGLGWARYVRIVAADHVVGPFGDFNAAFDLDAVAAVNSVPASDEDDNGIPDAVE